MSGTSTSYTEKLINFTIIKGTGNFGDGTGNTVTLTGLRSHCTITLGVGDALGELNARIYGLTPQIMNNLSSLYALDIQVRNNGIIVNAGDAINGMTQVFQGCMTHCYQDLNAQPETYLQIIARTSSLALAQPVAPISIQGTADVAATMALIGQSCNPPVQVINNGVNIKASNLYLKGSPLVQAQELARSYGVVLITGANSSQWTIAPKDGSVAGNGQPLISAATGMIGYPKSSSNGVEVRTLFNTQVVMWGIVQITSQSSQTVPGTPQGAGVNGLWKVKNVTHTIASQLPNGPWFTDIMGTTLGIPPGASPSSAPPGQSAQPASDASNPKTYNPPAPPPSSTTTTVIPPAAAAGGFTGADGQPVVPII